jgi:hypothetical protein
MDGAQMADQGVASFMVQLFEAGGADAQGTV